VVLVQNGHDGKNFLLHSLDGVDHVLVDRITIQGQGLCFGDQSQFVVLFDGLESGNARQKRFSAPGVTGKIMGLNRRDDDEFICFHPGFIDVHFRAVG